MVSKDEGQSESLLFGLNFRSISTYKNNDVIFQEGTRGREMYVVYSGKVQITKKDSSGIDKILSILDPGEIFGEMALIDQELRSATATAVEDDTKLIALDRARFMYLLRYEPEFGLIILEILCQRVREKNIQYTELLERSKELK